MILFPAIDIKDGKVVRLRQGKFSDVTEYSQDPVAMAGHWVAEGARWLHVVDLDGAQTGEIRNFKIISRIAGKVSVPVQMGGGIRTEDDIERLLKAGLRRVVLGTRVIENRVFLQNILSRWPENIAVSLDCSEGKVTQKGWTVVTDLRAVDFAKELEAFGLKCLIYTDIKTDGMLTGPNFTALEELLTAITIPVIASGGIARIDDVQNLLSLKKKYLHLVGAITGKAIYEGTLDLKEALALCSPNG